MNIPTVPHGHRLPSRLAAWTLSSTCTGGRGWEEGGDKCTDPKPHAPPSPIFTPNLANSSCQPPRLPPQDRISFPSWRQRWLEAVSRQELYKVKSFPHALCRLSASRAHLIAHLQPAAGAVLRTVRSSPCTRKPKKKNHAKNPLRTLDSAGDPRLHQALPTGVFLCRGCSCPARADHPAAAAAELAARSPGLEPRAEQRRSGRRRCHGGSQAEEGSREEENGSGRRGTGARDPNL